MYFVSMSKNPKRKGGCKLDVIYFAVEIHWKVIQIISQASTITNYTKFNTKYVKKKTKKNIFIKY